MKVYTNNKFEGYWPVGSAAVVVAPSRPAAAGLLQAKLKHIGLDQGVSPTDMVEIATDDPEAHILHDGNY